MSVVFSVAIENSAMDMTRRFKKVLILLFVAEFIHNAIEDITFTEKSSCCSFVLP